jgi:hypothetical protein
MARKISVAAFGLLVIIAGLLLAGEWSLHRHAEETCGICARHINPHTGVLADIGGRRRHVCCAHCAVTEGIQEHKPVRLIEVTDYNTERKLDPNEAWYVEGSRVVACTHDMSRMDETKRTQNVTFDRCSPGTLAFASRAEANEFAAANGGVVLDMEQMLGGVNGGRAQ